MRSQLIVTFFAFATVATGSAAAEPIVVNNGAAVRFLSNYAQSENRDADDPSEQLILFTPRGPLVVELLLAIDGKPFRMQREKLVDALLEEADTDGDDRRTWDEALRNPRFGFGLFGQMNEDQIANYKQNYDANSDNTIDRAEAVTMLLRTTGARSFFLQNNMYNYYGGYGGYYGGNLSDLGTGSVVMDLLDIDQDQVLSDDELAAAFRRLKSRDADDNDLLALNELTGTNGYGMVFGFSSRRGRVQVDLKRQVAAPLAIAEEADALYELLVAHYGAEDKVSLARFALAAKAFKKLDTDHDGHLSKDEAVGIAKMKPQIRLRANIGKCDGVNGGPGMSLVKFSKKLGSADEVVDGSGKLLAVNLDGLGIQFHARIETPTPDYTQSAENMIKQYDKDNNNYLEMKEMPNDQQQWKRQFALWDADGDGKVYADEIKQAYQRQQLPTMSRIAANAQRQANKLFSTLDRSGDNQLSLREMRGAEKNLQALDKNGDGKLTVSEVPDTLTISLGQGNVAAVYNYQGAAPNRTADTVKAPKWFTRMDRNGDGDISSREFLGTHVQFTRLDSDADGLIDPKEAGGKRAY